MTCIIGLELGNGVLMGCDSGSSDGWSSRVSTINKIFYQEKQERFLIGFTTSWRMGQIAHHLTNYNFRKQESGETDQEYLVIFLVESLRKEFASRGYSKIENNEEECGQLLVGYRGKLYMIDSDYHINRFDDGFIAIGSGWQYATGAMSALDGLPPRSRVKRALYIASMFSNTVEAPFQIYTLMNDGETEKGPTEIST